MTAGELVGFRDALDRLAAPPAPDRPPRLRLARVTGAGKSHLLAELARTARRRDTPVLTARGTETGRTIPFGALRDALHRSPGVAGASPDALLLLRAVFHSFLDPGHDRSTLLDAERHRLYRTVGDLVEAVARPAGLLVLFDDAHLADSGSLELLGHLLRHQPEADVTIVVTHPPETCPPEFAAAEAIELSAGDAAVPGIDLADLPVARAVAVLGGAEPRLVAAVAETALHETRAALVRLTSRGVLGVESDFRHARLRQSVYESADPDWRRAAHRRASAALADEGAPVTVRAHHVACSGDPAAVPDLIAAADAVSRVAPAIAAHWLDTASRLLPRTAVPIRLRVLRKLAAVSLAAGRPDEHRHATRAALETIPADRVWLRARIALRCAFADRELGHHDEADGLLRLELASTAHDRVPLEPGPAADGPLRRESATSTRRRSRVLLELGLAANPKAGVTEADAVVANARAMGDDTLLVLALGVRLRKPAYDLDLLDEAAALADRLATCPAEALLWLGRAETALERTADAVRHLERAVGIARTTDRGDLLHPLWQARGEALERLGRLAEADECFTDASESADLTGAPASLALAGRARVAVWRGEADEGLRLAELAVAAGSEHRAYVTLGLAQFHAGDPTSCVEHLLTRFGDPDPLSTVEWYSLMALADGARQRVEDALGWAEATRDVARRLPGGLRAAYTDLAWVGALRHTGPTEAAVHAMRAAETFERLGSRIHAGRARLMSAILFRVVGRPNLERRECDHAAALLDSCEPGLFDRVAGGWALTSDHSLTDRERKVLVVLAEGLTADAIARRMDISPRTVHRHLQHVYRKLGTTDRLSTVLRAQSLGLLTETPAAVGC